MDLLRQPWEGHDAALLNMGMRAEHFVEALGLSNVERKLCVHGHSAKSAPGYYAYNGFLTSLSRQMCTVGEWNRVDPLSMPMLISDSRKIAFTVSSGDQFTGLSGMGQAPKTKNPKGELTRELTRLNLILNREEGLFEAPAVPAHDLLASLQEFSFWTALVYFDRTELEIRSEVSQPRFFTSQGRIKSYYQRIQLPPYSLTEDDFPVDEDPNDGFDPPFSVTRRQ